MAELRGDAVAKEFVVTHHYARSYPAARFRFGLFTGGRLVGVAVFSHPCNDAVLTSVFPGPAADSVELGRFVLLDSVPSNGESWFLGRAFSLLRREGLRGVVSFSDPLPRRDATGHLLSPGHHGCVYQAHNGVYLGRATPRTLHLLPDGSVFSDRAAQKVRRMETGWRYAVEQLVAAGAERPDGLEDLGGWLRRSMGALATVRHPGNHKYAWGLGPLAKRLLPASLPYPRRMPL